MANAKNLSYITFHIRKMYSHLVWLVIPSQLIYLNFCKFFCNITRFADSFTLACNIIPVIECSRELQQIAISNIKYRMLVNKSIGNHFYHSCLIVQYFQHKITFLFRLAFFFLLFYFLSTFDMYLSIYLLM